MYDMNMLAPDKMAKITMIGKLLLVHFSIMMGANVTMTPPIVETSPVPSTLICVGNNSLKYT